MKKIIISCICFTVLGLISGCGNSVNTVSNAGVEAKITRINDMRVETDRRLARNLILTELRNSTTNDGFMRVQAFFKNRTKSTLKFVYRFNWYDDQGVEVENPDSENWVRKVVIAGDDAVLTSVAPKRTCKDFKLRLKELE